MESTAIFFAAYVCPADINLCALFIYCFHAFEVVNTHACSKFVQFVSEMSAQKFILRNESFKTTNFEMIVCNRTAKRKDNLSFCQQN